MNLSSQESGVLRIFTIGVEEEFHLVDPETREIAPVADRVLSKTDDDQVEPELQESQVETGSAVCETLDDVRRDLIRLRREASAAAADAGKAIAASGTHLLFPTGTPPTSSRKTPTSGWSMSTSS